MKQSRHWAAWMAALLIFLGLAILPREGAAWSRYTDPIEPVLFGDPDGPTATRATSADQFVFSMRITFQFAQGRIYIFLSPRGAQDAPRSATPACRNLTGPGVKTRP